jgi:hypothetical protein
MLIDNLYRGCLQFLMIAVLTSPLRFQLKRKATSEENDAAAEPSDCIITSPMPTSVSGKTVKASKAKAKNSKTGPQTPSSNVGECKHW